MRDDEPGGAPPDEVLVARARDGDERAVALLVDRHHEAVYRVAYALVSDPDAAEDVAQVAFVKAFQGLSGFRGDAAFRTWLLAITANAAKGALRSDKRRAEQSLDGVAEPADPAPSPESQALVSGEAARARAALAGLPEKQRLSVQLRIDEGLGFREIGELIGSSEGAARVNYFHGIRKLRETLS